MSSDYQIISRHFLRRVARKRQHEVEAELIEAGWEPAQAHRRIQVRKARGGAFARWLVVRVPAETKE